MTTARKQVPKYVAQVSKHGSTPHSTSSHVACRLTSGARLCSMLAALSASPAKPWTRDALPVMVSCTGRSSIINDIPQQVTQVSHQQEAVMRHATHIMHQKVSEWKEACARHELPQML